MSEKSQSQIESLKVKELKQKKLEWVVSTLKWKGQKELANLQREQWNNKKQTADMFLQDHMGIKQRLIIVSLEFEDK